MQILRSCPASRQFQPFILVAGQVFFYVLGQIYGNKNPVSHNYYAITIFIEIKSSRGYPSASDDLLNLDLVKY